MPIVSVRFSFGRHSGSHARFKSEHVYLMGLLGPSLCSLKAGQGHTVQAFLQEIWPNTHEPHTTANLCGNETTEEKRNTVVKEARK